ncbi:uncharacterized protein LOC136085098 [Hydra vulgaris]|uniref:Uncharacterized protein LOC136085098 n=1 Tax=Hydra vulgaris TaxID=6087 RepID=A0ABM4CL34_HYDVU
MKIFSDALYYNIKKIFIMPVVIKRWKFQRYKIIKMLRTRKVVSFVGDGRCDSPGHYVKYCTYTLMELESGYVIDSVVISVTEVKNSNCMEKEGFIRVLETLKKAGVKIDFIATDCHTQIQKTLKLDLRFNNINHQYNPWHVAKSISKKMHKTSKNSSKKDLLEWIPPVVNHFWWSVGTSNKNPHLMYEKFSSILYHIQNVHKWGGCSYFHKCEHEPYSKQNEDSRNWLDAKSDTSQFLVYLVKSKSLKEIFENLTEAIQTTNVEVFNNLLLKFIPKQYHFKYDHMVMGAYLAALDHNFNAE